ncbi:hypothetical protein [Mucilaginibacter sp.]|uniref:hypothetical protein n=1 Tax=Mucilaginibacter sp. TaxID=1882438 RepID=UPI002633213A|nr:hypothetical protein [Mucilaginibacter sp.]MDB5030306.1 hypothetical protein [Mucilaginibacter sp.]
MNSTVELIFTIIGGALTLLTLYGALKANRKFFLSGLCFFSILPIIGESMGYNADKASVHIIVILVFIAQFVLTFPNNIEFGPENTAASKLVGKISLAILVFNIGGIIYIFCLNSGVPARFGYFHVAFSLAIIYIIIKRMTGKGPLWVK